MALLAHHRGITYTVRELSDGCWEWELHPPGSVIGWTAKRGIVRGNHASAKAMAKREIEAQDTIN
jgi:hypothetical protein